MKEKIIKCAWEEICDGKVKMKFGMVNNEATIIFSRCDKCGNFSIIDNNKLIKYHPNK